MSDLFSSETSTTPFINDDPYFREQMKLREAEMEMVIKYIKQFSQSSENESLLVQKRMASALEQLVQILAYQPESPGYVSAKAEFNKLQE